MWGTLTLIDTDKPDRRITKIENRTLALIKPVEMDAGLRNRKNCSERALPLLPPFLCVSKMLVLSVADVLGNRIQHVDGRGVVAKGLAHVDEEIFIPGRKHKAAA